MVEELKDAEEVWVLKNPTELSPTALYPIKVMNTFYTACEEKESMYDGSYPLAGTIIEYEVADSNGYLVVPYKYGGADTQYGFYEFATKSQLKQWIKENTDKSKWLTKKYPEWFI